MNKMNRVFKNGKACIAFITCGDPDLETTEKLVCSMEQAGADLVELGIPFSDPTVEGPVIQEANLRALSSGTTTEKAFGLVEKVRRQSSVPLAFRTYANVVFSYGIEAFIRRMADLDMDALLIPDIPYEEKGEFERVCRACGIVWIPVVAPASGDRIPQIAADAQEFLYCVASPYIEEQREKFVAAMRDMAGRVRQTRDIPVAADCDVYTPEQACRMAAETDGVVLSSVLVEQIARYGKESPEPVAALVRAVKQAVSSERS